MAGIDNLAILYNDLKSKTLTITSMLNKIEIPEKDKNELNLKIREIQQIFNREPKIISDTLKNEGKKPNGNNNTVGQAPSKQIRIEVRDLNDKRLSAFYIDDKLKPDKIAVESRESCSKVKLKVSGGKFKRYRTVHMPGDPNKYDVKYFDTIKNVEIKRG